ncbi:hypothetical protein CC1G_15222 [Coprinopsis cinerea okayama7|uniref:Uncharacterized protein n=1 Tax=Coprinopsis cinerea (strain Okayama-7 / 130 / ATCC MYA-4618 / FGSC 9003) TaxID=240176 RepID=D6RPU0_COPC7|nr:hypothetical protein CC1G_15222 [Coprinopsis cinerea okayama7\|eukprot:XP_002910587.1 hypothetical protein CC1G_15222 [Coprinopsis cinerea okayama7\
MGGPNGADERAEDGGGGKPYEGPDNWLEKPESTADLDSRHLSKSHFARYGSE